MQPIPLHYKLCKVIYYLRLPGFNNRRSFSVLLHCSLSRVRNVEPTNFICVIGRGGSVLYLCKSRSYCEGKKRKADEADLDCAKSLSKDSLALSVATANSDSDNLSTGSALRSKANSVRDCSGPCRDDPLNPEG